MLLLWINWVTDCFLVYCGYLLFAECLFADGWVAYVDGAVCFGHVVIVLGLACFVGFIWV